MVIRLVSLHGFDPRGPKVGGIETHVRHLLRRHPGDMRLLLVGIDDFGDLPLGQLQEIEVAGRTIDFFPVLHIPSDEQTGAAKRLSQSATLRFAAALIRHLPKLRRVIGNQSAVIEVERYEYAPIARLLGRPLLTVIHNEGDPRKDKMDSILSKYWIINSLAERVSLRLSSKIFGVTPGIRDRIVKQYPRQAEKVSLLTVSVDTVLFEATPFDVSDGVLRLVYAGRLDEFKDPAMMFNVAAELHKRLDGAFEFHFCGSADPRRFDEFTAIQGCTICHGALMPEGVAAVMRQAHIGILVSHFEGMPCFLLELLASGRPFAGVRLPQFDQVVEHGVTGHMVERGSTAQDTLHCVANAIIAQWQDIKDGKVDPDRIHEKILPWSIDNQMGRLFSALRELAQPKGRMVVLSRRAADC